ncbi:MAG TPA: hypothetical protein GX506_11450 [Firmicutes bacterium]|nr:hypothetical protein [Bacillota bacterium]
MLREDSALSDRVLSIDTSGVYYRDLNKMLREGVAKGAREFVLRGVTGQRYIGTGLVERVSIKIFGTPGNDLGAFMDGPSIEVFGNAQDGLGNTMNSGKIVVHGNAGDLLGMAMRGGKIFVKGDAGCRSAIHMKEYRDMRPTVVIGGTARDFFAEYMAGGEVVLLGLTLPPGVRHSCAFMGTGMHGGRIYIRGAIDPSKLGKGVIIQELSEPDWETVKARVAEFAAYFDMDAGAILSAPFVKLCPASTRPYGVLYAGRN